MSSRYLITYTDEKASSEPMFWECRAMHEDDAIQEWSECDSISQDAEMLSVSVMSTGLTEVINNGN